MTGVVGPGVVGPGVDDASTVRSSWIGPPLLSTVAVVVALAFAAPIAYLVLRNLELGRTALDVLTSGAARRPFGTTVALASTVAVACTLLGTGTAWFVVRTDLPGRQVLRVLLALPLVIPSFVGALAFVSAFARNGVLDELAGVHVEMRGFWAAFGVLTLLSYPYVYLPVVARLASMPPSLEESARALGRAPRSVFATIVLPQMRAPMAAGALLVFLYVVSDFGAVSLLRVDTLTTRIDAARLFDPPTALALGLLLAVLALAVVAIARLLTRRWSTTEAVAAGRSVLVVPLGRWKAPVVVLVSSVVTAALVAPIVVLARWAWRGLSEQGGGPGDVRLGDVWTPMVNTATIAIATAIIGVAVVLPVAFLAARHRSRVGALARTLVVGGFALPGLVIALAVVFWVLDAPLVGSLYQTFPLLVFAYVVHFGAQALGASEVAVSGVPPRLVEAARSLGARRVSVLTTVEVPLMLPGLVAGAGLVLLSTMKELPATLLLAPTGFDTLATRIWGATESAFFGRAGLLALVLVALSGLLTWFLTIRHVARRAA